MKKFLYCKYLSSGINFNPTLLSCCCMPYKGLFLGLENNNFSNENFELFQKNREQAVENMKNMIPLDDCVGCVHLQEYNLESKATPKEVIDAYYNKSLIKKIQINHFKQCDCLCVYCNQMDYYNKVSQPVKSRYYDLLPIIQNFYKQNLIDRENLEVEFQGGSIAVLEEFPALNDIFIENGAKEIQFFTNGLAFLPQITKALEQTNCVIICSIDAGKRETFKKIKNTDGFEDVLNNLKQYSKVIRNNPQHDSMLITKYILLEGINDTADEIESFVEHAHNIGSNLCQFDLDYRKIMANEGGRYDIPKHFKDLYELFVKKSNAFCISTWIPQYTKDILYKD